MKKSVLLVTVVVVLAATQVFAFDGHRQGFVIGGGLGFSPVARWAFADKAAADGRTSGESRPGVGASIIIGYAFDEQDMLVYDGNAVSYSSKLTDKAASQGDNTFAWYHYYGPTGKCAFTAVGIGLYNFEIDGAPDFSSGLGFLLGGGYEFARHWQAGAYFGIGRTSQANVDFNHLHLSFIISTIAF